MFEETLLCYLSKVPWFKDRNGTVINCTTTDIAPGLTAGVHIYYEVVLHSLTPNTSFPPIMHNECQSKCYFFVYFIIHYNLFITVQLGFKAKTMLVKEPSCIQAGWSGVAKVSCILRYRGVQLILAYSWARPAILVACKGRGGNVSNFCFFTFIPVPLSSLPSLSSPLLSLLSLFSLSLGGDNKKNVDKRY